MNTPRIFDVVEREETSIPVSELWVGGKLEVLPEVLNRGFFQIRLSRDRLNVYAGQYVGLVPLNERVAINIQPRTPISNLLRVLGRSEAKIRSLAFFPVGYQAAASRPLALLEPMASTLVSQLHKLEAEGFRKEYTLRESDDPPLRGRVRFDRSVGRFWSKGLQHRAAISFYDLTANLPPNQVIKSAVDYLLRQFRLLAEKPQTLLRELGNYQELFAVMEVQDIEPLALKATEALSLAGTYRDAVDLASLIVQGRGIQLPPGGSVRLPSFFLDMAEVFESYLRNTLVTKLAPAFLVLNGNKDGARPLYDETPLPTATPDIVIATANHTRLVADVKYKTTPSRDDVNQVITYALRYSTQKALLACLSSAASGELERLGTIAGIEVYCYGFSLSGDLDSEEVNFADTVRDNILIPN